MALKIPKYIYEWMVLTAHYSYKAVVQRVRRIDRKRPLQEMLLMMWRSSRREIVKARKEVNGNDEP